jgi:lysophospholipase L1-like esterase
MVEAMDAVIGKILKKITAVGLEENTIIVFFSDNGGLSTKEGSPTSNKPFRAGKGWLYEGGIRVPLIIKSKKQIKAGTVSNTPVIAQDLYPTLLRMNNLAAMPTQHTEGIDFSPILMGKKITRKALYWHYPHYGNQGGFPGSAIRMGNWKLIQNFETNAYELYNLETDLGEKNNMANNQQERVTEMSTLLAAWQKATGAKLPSINNQAELAATKNYFIPVLQELKQKWPNNRTINLVFHGHSVPSGYFATPNINSVNAYPFLVFKAVSNQYNTATINSINTAIGGENSEQGAARFETTVLNHQPDVLFIDYALNDRGIGLVRAKAAWSAMIQKALAKQIKVVLLTPTPDLKENMFDDNTPLQQYANQIIALGKQYNVAVVDAYSSFKQLLMEGKDLQEYMAQNNHPNAQGHQVVASAILKLFNVQVNTAN